MILFVIILNREQGTIGFCSVKDSCFVSDTGY